MATRSLIAKQTNEGYKAVYCHWDGYPSHTGAVLVENYNSFFDVEILRFFFVYGERQQRSMLIPRIVDSIKEGRPITLQGSEGVRVNPIYVGDAVKSIIKVMDLKGSHKINIGGSEILSLKNIGDLIGSITGCTPIYKYEDKEPKNLISDIAKMKKLLLEPQTKFGEGIKKII